MKRWQFGEMCERSLNRVETKEREGERRINGSDWESNPAGTTAMNAFSNVKSVISGLLRTPLRVMEMERRRVNRSTRRLQNEKSLLKTQ